MALLRNGEHIFPGLGKCVCAEADLTILVIIDSCTCSGTVAVCIAHIKSKAVAAQVERIVIAVLQLLVKAEAD